MTAYYQPSLTKEYDEDSPGGDFDFFSNLVTKWEAAARLPGESTRQVVVRSGEDQGPGNQAARTIPGLSLQGEDTITLASRGEIPKSPTALNSAHSTCTREDREEGRGESRVVQTFKAKQPPCTTSLL